MRGTFTYDVTDNIGGSLDSMFHYYLTNKTITMYTTDQAKLSLSVYTIKVKGYQGTYTTAFLEITFTVTILLDC